MDWSTVVAAAVGAAIGLTGNLFGRIGARRQADWQRKQALEDSEVAYHRSRSEELERESRQRLHLAVDRILETFAINSIAVTAPNDAGIEERALNILLEIARQRIYILDPDVRRRLDLSANMLDYALSGSSPAGYTIAEVVFVIRNGCKDWLGALVRREKVPPPSGDWLELEGSLHDAMEKWHHQLADQGSRVHPRKYEDY
jgi:hypothetical protein